MEGENTPKVRTFTIKHEFSYTKGNFIDVYRGKIRKSLRINFGQISPKLGSVTIRYQSSPDKQYLAENRRD